MICVSVTNFPVPAAAVYLYMIAKDPEAAVRIKQILNANHEFQFPICGYDVE